MKVLAPAKINLNLLVLRKRKDSYHDIISLVDKVSIFDEIIIKKNPSGNKVVFESGWEIPESNTIKKTLDTVSELTGFFAEVVAKKRIPPGAGLGGASSDSASIIKAEVFKIPKSQQFKIAKKIGSDVPLFLQSGPAIVYGRGEKIKKVYIEGRERLNFVIIFPGIISLTKNVYEKFDGIGVCSEGDDSRRERILEFMQRKILEKNSVISLSELYEVLGWNDLEKPFFQLYPEAKDLKSEIDRVCKFYITGSGSAFFSVFIDEERAQNVYSLLRKKLGDEFPIFISRPVDI